MIGTAPAIVDRANKVLRISIIEAGPETLTMKLDGQIKGRWVKLLQRVCEFQMRKRSSINIDLRNVSFADREGIALLKNLTSRRVTIVGALPFIAEIIAGTDLEEEK